MLSDQAADQSWAGPVLACHVLLPCKVSSHSLDDLCLFMDGDLSQGTLLAFVRNNNIFSLELFQLLFSHACRVFCLPGKLQPPTASLTWLRNSDWLLDNLALIVLDHVPSLRLKPLVSTDARSFIINDGTIEASIDVLSCVFDAFAHLTYSLSPLLQLVSAQ